MFFLVSIFTVVSIKKPPVLNIEDLIIKVVTKLRATGERGEPADHQNWKAAKVESW